MTNNPTDLQAALNEVCEQIANELGAAEMLSGPCVDAARIIERRLTPVFEALRDSVIEECAEIARPVDDVLAGVILKLKGAPR